MSKTENTSPSTPPSAPNGQPDAARRALLRGAIKGAVAAVPAVVTLSSGSAWAAAGSVPCYNFQYAGRFELRNGQGNKVFFTNGGRAGRADISEFCWSSGTGQIIPYNQIDFPN